MVARDEELYAWKDRQREEGRRRRDLGDLEDSARFVEAIVVAVCLICSAALLIWVIACST